jgi:hypothetical protein
VKSAGAKSFFLRKPPSDLREEKSFLPKIRIDSPEENLLIPRISLINAELSS